MDGKDKQPANAAGVGLLKDAAHIIQERGVSYGSASDNLRDIASLWTVLLGVKVTAQQVASCMIAVKQARLKTTPDHRDSILDIAGYAATMAEVI